MAECAGYPIADFQWPSSAVREKRTGPLVRIAASRFASPIADAFVCFFNGDLGAVVLCRHDNGVAPIVEQPDRTEHQTTNRSEQPMIKWAIIFAIISVIAGIFG